MATYSSQENAFVRAKLKSDPSGITQCVNTGVQCDDTGTSVCTIYVPVTGGSTVVETYSTYKPYRVGCVVELYSSDGGGISDVSTIDRIVQ